MRKAEAPSKVDEFIEWSKGPLQEEGLCPACGYYMGAAFVCPRCGARGDKKTSVRLIKVWSVILSFVGIVLLWMTAQNKAPFPVKVSDIDVAMNGALVKVVGRVAEVMEDPTGNSMRWTVDDGSGATVSLTINNLAAFKKFHGANMPKIGDEVEVSGTVNETSKYGVSMFMNVPERIKLRQHYKPVAAQLGSMATSCKQGDIVRIVARITKKEQKTAKSSGKPFWIIHINDGTGEATARIFSNVIEQMTPATAQLLDPGEPLEILVRIDKLVGGMKPELEFVDYGALKRAVAPPPPAPVPAEPVINVVPPPGGAVPAPAPAPATP